MINKIRFLINKISDYMNYLIYKFKNFNIFSNSIYFGNFTTKKSLSFLFKTTLITALILSIFFTAISKSLVHYDDPDCEKINFIIKNKCIKTTNGYKLTISNLGNKILLFEINGKRYNVLATETKDLVIISPTNKFDIVPIIEVGAKKSICKGKTETVEVLKKC